MAFVRVTIAGKPKDQTFVIAQRDVDPAVHTVVEALASHPSEARPVAVVGAVAPRAVVTLMPVHIVGKSADAVFMIAAKDFDATKHTRVEAAPVPPPPTPLPNIAELNAIDARALVESVDAALLPALLKAEQENQKYAGGRKSVLDAIEERLTKPVA